jgi:propanol-preferring alcohol dehydrogenase
MRMKARMPAYRLLEWQQAPKLVEVDVPRPGPGQVLVRVAGNGLCHSDIGMTQMPASIGELVGWSMPFTLGHEIAGRVEDAGEGAVDTYGRPVAAGATVALVSPSSCGRCRYCRRGLDSACPNGLAGRGYGRDGGLAAYVVADASRSVLPLANLDPVAAAPLTDAGATSYHAVRRALHLLEPGSNAVVLGAGGLGSFAIQFLRALSPARVIAVDQHAARRDYARELGAAEAIGGVDGQTAGILRELTGGEGADLVLDFVGIDASIAAGLRSVRSGGAFGLVGASGGTFRGPWMGGLPKDADIFTFQGSCISDAQAVISLAEAGLIRSDVDVFPLEQVTEAYLALDRGELHGRAVVTPG